MVSLFRRPGNDLDPLRDAVASLGSTTVPGLAAALGWRERRTEKALFEELARTGTPLAYDPALRLVRWASVGDDPPSPSADPSPNALPGAGSLPPHDPHAALTPSGVKQTCPSCRVPLVAAASGALVVCPHCGRLAHLRNRGVVGGSPNRTPPPLPDRRSEEMFAAYVNSGPIPCPKCQTPLRHRGVSEYGCPACGEVVRFGAAFIPTPSIQKPVFSSSSGTSRPRPAPVPAGPAAPPVAPVVAPRGPTTTSRPPATAPLGPDVSSAPSPWVTAPPPLPTPGVSGGSSANSDIPMGDRPMPDDPSAGLGRSTYLPRMRASCRAPPRNGT
jgi:predicted RNA-binding Zn-ribbon protein involved in translation (DUF1610 family)